MIFLLKAPFVGAFHGFSSQPRLMKKTIRYQSWSAGNKNQSGNILWTFWNPHNWQSHLTYLVGGWALPLWKIWVRQLGWLFHSQHMEKCNSCSSHHQPDITRYRWLKKSYPAYIQATHDAMMVGDHRAILSRAISSRPRIAKFYPSELEGCFMSIISWL